MPNDLPVPPPVPQPVNQSTALQAIQGYPAPALYGGAQLPGSGPDWRRILAAVMRFKWLVLGVVVLGTAAGFGLSRFLFKPGYDARARIWVDIQDRTSRTQQQSITISPNLSISTGWKDLLYSDAVMDWVVRRRHLYLGWASAADSSLFTAFDIQDRFLPGIYTLKVDSAGRKYTLVGEDGSTVESGAVGDSIGRRLGWMWAPPASVLSKGRVIPFSVASPHETALNIALQLAVREDENGNFMTLDLKQSNAEVAAGTLNAIIDRFVTQAGDMKSQKLREVEQILGRTLKEAQGKLAQAEAALRAFRVRSATQLALTNPNNQQADTRDPSANAFFTNRMLLDQVQQDRQVIERVLAAGTDSAVHQDELENVPSVQRSTQLTAALRELTSKQADLRTLRYRYTDEQPSVRALARDIDELQKRTIPTMAQALLAELQVRENDLRHLVAQGSSSVSQISSLAIDDAVLQRNVTTAEQTLAAIQQNYDQVRLAEMSDLPDLKILDRAVVPMRPVGSLAPVLIVLAFLGSLGAGVVGAVLLDKTDTRFRYPEQVTTDMGLNILGVVPRVSRENGNGRNAPQVIEALRSIRLGVQNAYGAGPMVLTITSPGSSDGKSFITSNLGLAFADAGLRTIVIDGDIRRGLLHRVLNAKRKPGLIDHLSGNAGREDIIQKTDFPQLSFIGCGQRTPNGPELLSSPAMGQLLTALRSRFDVILVDSAPMAAGVDPYVLGTLTGNLLLVMRTGVTDRELAQAKIDLLDRLPVRVLGAVLNDVEAGGAYRYYAYYLAGYEVSEEDADRKLVRPG
ncbi:MAG TPA: polysaccharide biosynthesis tyrosine autokinase [Gemmatimonadales bacterium]|nr:polysaccharide biosynthesis tyrosine autokinase [Gemmatimonadales bacterium]